MDTFKTSEKKEHDEFYSLNILLAIQSVLATAQILYLIFFTKANLFLVVDKITCLMQK